MTKITTASTTSIVLSDSFKNGYFTAKSVETGQADETFFQIPNIRTAGPGNRQSQVFSKDFFDAIQVAEDKLKAEKSADEAWYIDAYGRHEITSQFGKDGEMVIPFVDPQPSKYLQMKFIDFVVDTFTIDMDQNEIVATARKYMQHPGFRYGTLTLLLSDNLLGNKFRQTYSANQVAIIAKKLLELGAITTQLIIKIRHDFERMRAALEALGPDLFAEPGTLHNYLNAILREKPDFFPHVINLLKRYNIDFKTATIPHCGSTILHTLIMSGFDPEGLVDTIDTLKTTNFDLTKSDNSGRTPLHIAVMCRREEIVAKLFLEYVKANKVAAERQDRQGKTAFHLAYALGLYDSMQLPFFAQVGHDIVDVKGRTPQQCLDMPEDEVKEILAEVGTNPSRSHTVICDYLPGGETPDSIILYNDEPVLLTTDNTLTIIEIARYFEQNRPDWYVAGNFRQKYIGTIDHLKEPENYRSVFGQIQYGREQIRNKPIDSEAFMQSLIDAEQQTRRTLRQ